jgi:hypothetical protein
MEKCDQPQILEVCFGRMVVGAEKHTKDLKIVGCEVKGSWWRGQGHLLVSADISDILANVPDVLVIGSGMSGMMQVDESLKLDLAEMGISVIVLPTDKAAAKYNELVLLGKKVDAAFHLTC